MSTLPTASCRVSAPPSPPRTHAGHLLHRRNKRDTVEKPPVRRFAGIRCNGAPYPRRFHTLRCATPGRRPGGRMFSNSDELLKYIKDEGVEMVDVRFCDLPGVMQHFTVPVSVVRPVGLRRRPRLRRLVDPWLPGHPRVRHVAVPGPDHGLHRPVPRRQDAGRQLLHPRPDHRRGLLPRPAQHRQEGDGLPRLHRHRRHRVLRPRGRVLRLRQASASRPRQNEPASTTSTPRRAPGTPASRGRTTAATRSSTRAATSRSRRTTTSATCATRWSSSWRSPASRSSAPTTRSAPPARPRSTTSSTSCSRPPTT